ADTLLDRRGHAVGVPANPMNHGRREGVEEVEAYEIQPWLIECHASLLLWSAVRVEHGKVDPGEAGMEPCAPDDVSGFESPAVFEDGPAVLHPRHAWGPLDAGSRQVSSPGSDERPPLGKDLRAHLPSHQSVHRQNVVEKAAKHYSNQDRPADEAADTERYLAGVPSRHPDLVSACGLDRDLRARVASPHDGYRALLHLR